MWPNLRREVWSTCHCHVAWFVTRLSGAIVTATGCSDPRSVAAAGYSSNDRIVCSACTNHTVDLLQSCSLDVTADRSFLRQMDTRKHCHALLFVKQECCHCDKKPGRRLCVISQVLSTQRTMSVINRLRGSHSVDHTCDLTQKSNRRLY